MRKGQARKGLAFFHAQKLSAPGKGPPAEFPVEKEPAENSLILLAASLNLSNAAARLYLQEGAARFNVCNRPR